MLCLDCEIEEIVAAHPDLCLDHFAIMAVAMMRQPRESKARFRVLCSGFRPAGLDDEELDLRVAWRKQTLRKARRMARSEQIRPMIERGAVALAMLLFQRLIPVATLHVCGHGERDDYWLPDLQAALEISGTLDGRMLERRFRLKQQQARGNSFGWDSYVVVCSFDPLRREILWGYQRKEEP